MNNDFHECVQHIQEPALLKEKITALYKKYVPNGVEKQELDIDIEKEYNRQKEYLDKSVQSLKHKLILDSDVHRQDNVRVLQENVSLIKEINELRKEITFLKHEKQQQKLDVKKNELQENGGGKAAQNQPSAALMVQAEENKREIAKLRQKILDKEMDMGATARANAVKEQQQIEEKEEAANAQAEEFELPDAPLEDEIDDPEPVAQSQIQEQDEGGPNTSQEEGNVIYESQMTGDPSLEVDAAALGEEMAPEAEAVDARELSERTGD